jgi:hypothetical protein
MGFNERNNYRNQSLLIHVETNVLVSGGCFRHRVQDIKSCNKPRGTPITVVTAPDAEYNTNKNTRLNRFDSTSRLLEANNKSE